LPRSQAIALGGLDLIPDLSGALYLPEFRTLMAADLHLEKASSLARRGLHLPPYDTRATLAQLGEAISLFQPERLILLGDSFHDGKARERIAADDLAILRRLTDSLDVIWIAGNHDPEHPADLGGRAATSVSLGPVMLRHEPGGAGEFEIAGHLHPSAAISQRGRMLRTKCFVCDGRRLVMPALGSFTGGLSVTAAPFAALYPSGDFHVWMLGTKAVHRFPSSRLF
jgi:DNA ligase-associated metallophosphoesterase